MFFLKSRPLNRCTHKLDVVVLPQSLADDRSLDSGAKSGKQKARNLESRGRKMRNVLRGLLQAHGTTNLKRRLWNIEFSRGRWDCLGNTQGDCVYEYIEKYANGGTILDLGCGLGNTGNELDATSYCHYTGVDISDVAIQMAKEKTAQNRRVEKNQYLKSDILSYVPLQRYDVILFRDSIYYIPYREIKAMIQRYAKHLNEGGVFIVRMWSAQGKHRRIVEIIENNFQLVETSPAQSTTVVLVFR
jgi:SAM-dependent methyltransferase